MALGDCQVLAYMIIRPRGIHDVDISLYIVWEMMGRVI